MKAVVFADEAKRSGSSIEAFKLQFESELAHGEFLGIVTPNKAEAIIFETKELDDLIAELSDGKISLPYLSEHLNLNNYQVHSIIQHLLKTKQVNGELTYNTFIATSASRLELLQKAKTQKQEHRRKLEGKINKQFWHKMFEVICTRFHSSLK